MTIPSLGITALLAGYMRGVAVAAPAERTPVPIPKYIAEMPRRQRLRFERKRARTRFNRAGREHNRKQRLAARDHGEHAERQRLVNAMTNHQRNQWARAGYPQDLNDVRRHRYPLHVRLNIPFPEVA